MIHLIMNIDIFLNINFLKSLSYYTFYLNLHYVGLFFKLKFYNKFQNKSIEIEIRHSDFISLHIFFV